jgi:hypothetical protein
VPPPTKFATGLPVGQLIDIQFSAICFDSDQDQLPNPGKPVGAPILLIPSTTIFYDSQPDTVFM